MYSLWQDVLHGTIIFYLVTLTMKFDLLLKNFNLGHNFLTRSDRVFYFAHMYSLWQDLSNGIILFYLVTLTLEFDLLLKTLTLAITFLLEVIELSHCTCVFIVTRPFTWYHNFFTILVTLTLKFDLLLKKKISLGHNFQTRRNRAIILHMCILCDKTFHMVL